MAKDTAAKYWADTEVLETFMGHIYSKVSNYVKKQLNSITKHMSDAESSYNQYNRYITDTKTSAAAYINQTAADASAYINQTAADASAYINQTAATCDASMNEWRNTIDDYIAGLKEAVLTQAQYDALIQNAVTTDSRGINYYFLSDTDVTTLTTSGTITKGSIVWTYNKSNQTVSATEHSNIPLQNFINGQTTTYYIIEES